MLKIKAARIKRGISRYKLATLTGISYRGLSNIENGSDVLLSTLEKIAGALGCTVAELLEEGDSNGN